MASARLRTIAKWAGIGLGGLLGLALLVGFVLWLRGGSRIARTYDITPAAVVIPDDSVAVARGRHLAESVTLCVGCHGDDLGGGPLVDDPVFATIWASNLTRGAGGVGGRYTDADFVRAVRHGVNREGRGLMIMHSDAYHNLDAEDLGAVIAWMRSMPPVDHEVPVTRGGPLGRVFMALGLIGSERMPIIPAEVIDHEAPVPAPLPRDSTPAYGEYLVSIALCHMCHGPDLSGGPPFEEGGPPAPNIAGYAAPGGWTVEQFIQTLRTGTTPFGRALDGEVMPWEHYGRMSDTELTAIWRYVATLNEE